MLGLSGCTGLGRFACSLFLIICLQPLGAAEDCKKCAADFKDSGGCGALAAGKPDEVDRRVMPECSSCFIKTAKKCGFGDQMKQMPKKHLLEMLSQWEQASFIARGPDPVLDCSSKDAVEGTCSASAVELPAVVDSDCSAGAPSLETFLGPIKQQFEATYWQRRPVLIRRRGVDGGICNDTFADIFDTDFAELFPHVFRSAEGDGKLGLLSFTEGDEYLRLQDQYSNIFLAYLDGISFILQSFDAHWPHAAHFCQRLTDVIPSIFRTGAPPKLNLYITPPGKRQPFGLHNDEQDVMIMQLSGKKHWRVLYERVRHYRGDAKFKLGSAQTEAPALKAILEPGDLLYIPRLHSHEAFTDEFQHSTSLSLTIPHRDSKADNISSRESQLGQKKILQSFPLPQGQRVGRFTMASRIPFTSKCADCDYTSLMADIEAAIKKDSDKQMLDRSLSHRILETIAHALSSARAHDNQSFVVGDLPVLSKGRDNFEKLALMVVLNWLGYGQI